MSTIARYFISLVVCIVIFLVVVGSLLLSRNYLTDGYSTLNDEFFVPSQRHLAQAMREVERIGADLHRESYTSRPAAPVPVRFKLAASLTRVDENLAELNRIHRQYDYQEAFDLPSRARRQFDSARAILLAAAEVTHENVSDLVESLDPLRNTLAQLERIYEIDRLHNRQLELEATAKHGRFMWIAAIVLVLVAAPLITRLGIQLRNALRNEVHAREELVNAKQELETLALYDNLTGLANRHLFRVRLDQAAASSRRAGGQVSALLYIDLDHFKRINDALGHDTGDAVLRAIGARLLEGVRSADTVARIGGDEFTVIVSHLSDYEKAGAIAEKLLGLIAEPVDVSGHELVVSASIGITIMPTDSADPAVLMKNADMAMYKAKGSGRHRFHFFVEDMNRAIVEHMRIEQALRAALTEEKFELYYQPQLSLDSGNVGCIEALLRWRGADGRWISPEHFLPVAEDAGLLPEIGDWVLRTACRDTARMHQCGAFGLRVAINLSARQFRDRRLLTRIEHALSASGLDPKYLEVEITESTLMDSVDEAAVTLSALRRLGTTVAIDDFGIGYSSLNYLKRLPIDALKIDRSFVCDIEVDEGDRSIVGTIIAMAGNLSLRVIAEGVETAGQLEHLVAGGCDAVQGFLLSEPLPAEQLAQRRLKWRKTDRASKDERILRLID